MPRLISRGRFTQEYAKRLTGAPEDREPAIGSTMRVAPQPGRTLLYNPDDGDLIETS